MKHCPAGACWPWNLPLTFQAVTLKDGSLVGMSYTNWIIYHWHVLIHQTNDDGSHSWPGELAEVTFTQ